MFKRFINQVYVSNQEIAPLMLRSYYAVFGVDYDFRNNPLTGLLWCSCSSIDSNEMYQLAPVHF